MLNFFLYFNNSLNTVRVRVLVILKKPVSTKRKKSFYLCVYVESDSVVSKIIIWHFFLGKQLKLFNHSFQKRRHINFYFHVMMSQLSNNLWRHNYTSIYDVTVGGNNDSGLGENPRTPLSK